LVYISDEGHHPSTYYHRVLKKMTDPRRPWRHLEWIRIVDFYHACGYLQQLADTIFGAGAEAQKWAKEMRRVLKTKSDGVARVLKSASALRRGRGLCGPIKAYDKAYAWADANWLSIGPIYRSKKILHFVPTHDPHKVIFSIVTIRVLRSNVFRYPPHPG
jgi:hypothetical protein